MSAQVERMKRIRTLAVSVGVALGVALSMLGPHLAQAATLWPTVPLLDLSDPPVDMDLDAPPTPAA
jgi:hypothetical protein